MWSLHDSPLTPALSPQGRGGVPLTPALFCSAAFLTTQDTQKARLGLKTLRALGVLRDFPAWPGLLACAAFGLAYALTLQRQINGAVHIQMMDVAEMQIVLASWGTLHPSGYPLYTILGNLFVAAGVGLGAPAAVASAGFSWLLGLAALLIMYRLGWELYGARLPALAAVVLLGVSRTFWLFASVAQTYTMNAVLIGLLLWLSLCYSRYERPRDLVLTGLVVGATLVHHRTIVHLLPWLGLLVILPVLWRRRPWRAILAGGVLIFLPLVLYLYIPLRTAQGAAYQYMPVRTAAELWYFVSQQEYSPHFRLVASLAEALERMGHALALWVGDLSAVGLLAGIAGLLAGGYGKPPYETAGWRWTPERRFYLALALSAFSMAIFPLWYVDPDSMFIPLVMLLALGAGELTALVARRGPRAAWLAGGLLVGVVGVLAPGNFAFVRSLTADPSSRDLVEAAAAIPADCPTILSHWGWDLKAYQYGQFVTGQLRCARLLTPSDDVRSLLRAGQSVYLANHFFYQMTPEEFQQGVGRHYLNSAGYGMIEVSKQLRSEPPADLQGQPTPMGADVVLLGYCFEPEPDGSLDLALFWQATAQPAGDYSVFVHVSDRDAIAGPADIIAQADSAAPVYGWYPTSQWPAGQVVRDDYRITPPPGSTPRLLAVGMYTHDESGAFRNLGVVHIPLIKQIFRCNIKSR